MENCLSAVLIAFFYIFQHCLLNQLCSLLLYGSHKNTCGSSEKEQLQSVKEHQRIKRETIQASVLGLGAAKRPVQK